MSDRGGEGFDRENDSRPSGSAAQPKGAMPHDHRRARRPATDARLTRASARVLGGVASGVAQFTGADPRGVRLLWLVSIPFTGGLSAVAYLLLWVLLPGPARRG